METLRKKSQKEFFVTSKNRSNFLLKPQYICVEYSSGFFTMAILTRQFALHWFMEESTQVHAFVFVTSSYIQSLRLKKNSIWISSFSSFRSQALALALSRNL